MTYPPTYDLDSYDDDTPMQARSQHEEIVTDKELRELLAAMRVKAVIA